MNSQRISRFVKESNEIEGIKGIPEPGEVLFYESFFMMPKITIRELEVFVGVVQPGAKLRDRVGLNVQVGNHVPPAGGPKMRENLQLLLDTVEVLPPQEVHLLYENLHPFTDGNGRSGRALWAWQMINQGHDYNIGIDRGFLHQFYYQTLGASDDD